MKPESASRVYVELQEHPKERLWRALARAAESGEELAARFGSTPLEATEAARTAAVLVLGARRWAVARGSC